MVYDLLFPSAACMEYLPTLKTRKIWAKSIGNIHRAIWIHYPHVHTCFFNDMGILWEKTNSKCLIVFFPVLILFLGKNLTWPHQVERVVEIISTAGNDHMTSPFESMIFVPTSGERWEICDRSQGSEYDCKGHPLVPFLQLQTEPQLAEESLTGVLSGTLSFLLWNAIEGPKKCLPLPKITSVP